MKYPTHVHETDQYDLAMTNFKTETTSKKQNILFLLGNYEKTRNESFRMTGNKS